jgi:hypothetical protein
MGRNIIQFQTGLSVPEFLQLYGTEAQCEEALAQIRWADGFQCPRCNGLSMASCTAEDSSVTNAGNAGTRPL